MNRRQRSDLAEQTAIERAMWDYRASGIILCALEEPEMQLVLLAERFGEQVHVVGRLLSGAGIQREHDHFSDAYNGRRRAA